MGPKPPKKWLVLLTTTTGRSISPLQPTFSKASGWKVCVRAVQSSTSTAPPSTGTPMSAVSPSSTSAPPKGWVAVLPTVRISTSASIGTPEVTEVLPPNRSGSVEPAPQAFQAHTRLGGGALPRGAASLLD